MLNYHWQKSNQKSIFTGWIELYSIVIKNIKIAIKIVVIIINYKLVYRGYMKRHLSPVCENWNFITIGQLFSV